VTVIDTKNPGWGAPLLEKIKTLTPKPVTMIINTHTHGDHVSGNVEFPANVDIVAHENTKANMTAMRPASFVAPPAGGPPPNIFTQNNGKGMAKRTFKDSMTVGSGADRIELHYFGPAHTNGDTMVFFPAARVLHMADVFATKGLPGMDSNNGGTGVGYVNTLKKAADFADKNNVEAIVNGHFATTTSRADLREFIDYVGDFVKSVQDGKRSGKSVDDVAKAWATPAKYKGYEAMPVAVRVRANVELIFKETK
jgi:cyclase